MAKNVLYYGDNLDILRRYIKDETIDLICLAPLFQPTNLFSSRLSAMKLEPGAVLVSPVR